MILPGVLSQALLTDVVADDRDHHLLQHLLVLPPRAELVLPPPVTDAVFGGAGSLAGLRETDWIDMLGQFEFSLSEWFKYRSSPQFWGGGGQNKVFFKTDLSKFLYLNSSLSEEQGEVVVMIVHIEGRVFLETRHSVTD